MICVVGDAMVDVWVDGVVRRISPEAPVPVLEVTEITTLPGGAANVLHNLQSLGAESIGAFNTHQVPTKVRFQSGATSGWSQSLLRVDYEAQADAITDVIPVADKYIIADYGKGAITQQVLDQCLNSGKPVFVDTKRDPTPYAGWVTAIFPNKDEYETFRNTYSLFERCIVTLGHEGCVELRFGKEVQRYRAYAQRVECVSGAGDTFTAAATLRWPARDWLQYASFAAAVAVSKPRTATVTPEELTRAKRIGLAADRSQRRKVKIAREEDRS